MQTIHLEAENTRKTGSLKIKKTEENSGKALSGATYQVIASGAITTVNGTVLFPDQAVAAVLKTDENGEAFKDGLEYGTYLVRETAAPNGYVLDPTEKKITIGEQNATDYTDVYKLEEPFCSAESKSGRRKSASGSSLSYLDERWKF